VTSTILSGTLNQDDPLVLLLSGIETRARSLETQHREVEQAYAGQRVGMNVHRIPMEQVARGMLLASPGFIDFGFLLDVDLKVLKTSKGPTRNRQRLKIYFGKSHREIHGLTCYRCLLESFPGDQDL
jgi:selenocysteine-specific elongation factor